MKRRKFLLATALGGVGPNLLGCGGGSHATSTSVSQSGDWSVQPPVVLVASQVTYDLSTTIPTSLKAGGTFAVASSGSALPAGVTLTPAGLLSAESSAALGMTSGVVFSYTEP